MENKKRTLKFICKDNWDNHVYKSIETGILYKDLSPNQGKAELYSCGNEVDGDPCYPINPDIQIEFIDRKVPDRALEFNYMMLGRLQMDCEYYLGYGNRYANHLYYKDEQKQINEMKKLHNSFPEDKKPEWLTYAQILEYEKLMTRLIPQSVK